MSKSIFKFTVLVLFLMTLLVSINFAQTEDTGTVPINKLPVEEINLIEETREKYSNVDIPDSKFFYWVDENVFNPFRSENYKAVRELEKYEYFYEKIGESESEEERQEYIGYIQQVGEKFRAYADIYQEEIKNLNEFERFHEIEVSWLVFKEITDQNRILLETGTILSEKESEIDDSMVTVIVGIGDALAEIDVKKEELAEILAQRQEVEVQDVKDEIKKQEVENGIDSLRNAIIIKEYLDLKQDVEEIDTLLSESEEQPDDETYKILRYARDTLLYRGEMDFNTVGETRKIILELKDMLAGNIEDASGKLESLKNDIIRIESERMQRDYDRRDQFEKALEGQLSDSEKLDLLDRYYNDETSGGLGFSHVSDIFELENNGLSREQAFQVMARVSLDFDFNRDTMERIAREVSGNADFKLPPIGVGTATFSNPNPVYFFVGDLGVYKSLTERGVDKETAAQIAVMGTVGGINRQEIERLLKQAGYDGSTLKDYYAGGGIYYGRDTVGDASPGTFFAIKQGFLAQGISESEAIKMASSEMINRLIDAGENPIRAIRRTDEAERSLVRPYYGRLGDIYGPPAGSGLGLEYDRRVEELKNQGLSSDVARAQATKEMNEKYFYGVNTFGPGDASPTTLSSLIASTGSIEAAKEALIERLISSGETRENAERRVAEAERTYNTYSGITSVYGAPAGSGLGLEYDKLIQEGKTPEEATETIRQVFIDKLISEGRPRAEAEALARSPIVYGPGGTPYSYGGGYYSGSRSGLGDASPAAVREKGVEAVRAELKALGVSEAEIGARIAEAQAAIARSYVRGEDYSESGSPYFGDTARNTAYQELINSGLRPEQAESVLAQTPNLGRDSLEATARQVTGNPKLVVSTTYGGTGGYAIRDVPTGTKYSDLDGTIYTKTVGGWEVNGKPSGPPPGYTGLPDYSPLPWAGQYDYGPNTYAGGVPTGTTVTVGGVTYTVTSDKGWTDVATGQAVPPPPGYPSSATGSGYSGGYYGGGPSGPYYSGGYAGGSYPSYSGGYATGTPYSSYPGGYYGSYDPAGPNYAGTGTPYTGTTQNWDPSTGTYYSGSGAYTGGTYSGTGTYPSGYVSGETGGTYTGGTYSGTGTYYSGSGAYTGGTYSGGYASTSGTYTAPSSGGEPSGTYSGTTYSGGTTSGGESTSTSTSSGGDSSSTSTSSGGDSSSTSTSSGGESTSAPTGDAGSTSTPTGNVVFYLADKLKDLLNFVREG